MTYQWFIQYPWQTNMAPVPGATSSYLTITNVDSWVGGYVDPDGTPHWTLASVLVTNGNGESLWLGPAYLDVVAPTDYIPATNYLTYQGPTTRYPITNNVFGLPTNFNRVSVTVTLRGLSHNRSADVSVLVVSPSGKGIMLMSSLGGTSGISYGTLSFNQAFSRPSQSAPLLPPWPLLLQPVNYGQVSQMPGDVPDPPPPTYSASLDDLQYDNPNGPWRLYIYDMDQGLNGHLDSSWQLGFIFQ